MAQASIKIGASTSEYQQAMKQATAQMKQLSSEYSLAAAQAKLYGSSSDALKAKVTELTGKMDVQRTSVENAKQRYSDLQENLQKTKQKHEELKGKVDAARQAYEQSCEATGKDSEESKKLKEELTKLEGQLSSTERLIGKQETALQQQKAAVTQSEAALAEMEVQLRDVNAELAKQKFDEYAEKAQKVGTAVEDAGKKMMIVTGAIGGMATASVKTAADFDSEMSKVSAISGATGDDLQTLRDKAREMGSKTKFSASEAAQGMEYMAMAGWKTSDMVEGLDGIMNLAAASGEELGTTSDIVTDALTAFGLSAKDSTHFADVLAAASSNANTNVSMMGETFKYAAPVAGALGFSVEDTAEAIGLMANSGIKGSQAGTALRSIMTNLAGEVKLCGASFGEVTIATQNSDGSMRSLSEILTDCRGAFSQMTEAEQASAAESLVGKNAMSGFLALMNAGEGDINKLSSAIQNCDGTSEEMANTMNDNLNGQLTILKSQIEELAISFGEMLMPVIRDIVGRFQAFIDKLNGMDEGQRKVIIQVAAMVAAIGPALVVIGKLIQFTGNVSSVLGKMAAGLSKAGGVSGLLTKAIGGLQGAFSFLLSPAGLVVAAIAAVTAAVIYLWNTNEDFRNTIIAIWNNIKAAFETFGQGITDRLNSLGFDFQNFTEVVKAIWDGFCNLLAPVIEGVFNYISIFISTTLDVILGVFDFFINLFQGNWSGCWDAVKGIFETIWNGMKAYIENILNAVTGVVDVFLGWFGTSWSEVWQSIKDFFEGIWNGISTFFSNILTGIETFASNVWNGITSTITTVWTAISTFFETVWTAISTTVTTWMTNIWNTISSIFTTVQEIVTTVWETIKNVIQVAIMFIVEIITFAFELITVPFRFIWENCKDTIMEVWNAITSFISSALTTIQTTIETVWNAVSTFFTTILTAIQTTFSTVWTFIKDNIITPITTAIRTTITTVWTAISTFFTTTMNTIRTMFTTAWNAIKTTITTVINAIKTTITTVFNSVKTVVTNIWNGIENAISTAFNAAKNTVTSVINSIRSTVQSVFNSVKSTVTSVWNSIKNAISTPINAAKNAVSSALNGIRSTVSSVFNSVKSSVTSTWNAIKNAIMTPINAAKNAVGNAINAIKSKFNFSWSLPHLKLPHVSISGRFSLTPPSIPTFSISWYKNGGIMTQPTVFGGQGQTLFAGGEAGDEAILPLAPFYASLSTMLDSKFEKLQNSYRIQVTVVNEMDGEVIAEKTTELVADKIVEEYDRRR